MEYEVRFYYSYDELNNLVEKLDLISDLKKRQECMKRLYNLITAIAVIIFMIIQ